jgi:hypothetical protein
MRQLGDALDICDGYFGSHALIFSVPAAAEEAGTDRK